MRVNVIGAGKVGKTLLLCLRDLPEFEIADILSSSPETSRSAVELIGRGRSVATFADMRPADLWLITVPDDRIRWVANQLAEARSLDSSAPSASRPVVMHCSGFLTSLELAPLRRHGWQVASFHPVLTFADPASAAARFPGTYCGIEGDVGALPVVENLITRLGAVPFRVNPEHKTLYHAAAVFSTNFTVVLQAIALEAWRGSGVKEDVRNALFRSLLSATVENLERLDPATALTGPAARGDLEVVRKQHTAIVEWEPEAGQVYALMSDLAGRLKKSGSPFV